MLCDPVPPAPPRLRHPGWVISAPWRPHTDAASKRVTVFRSARAIMHACPPAPPSKRLIHANRAALVTLDLKFRSLHLYHSHVLAGVQLTAAYLDLAANRLHLVSNGGGARAVVVAARPDAPDVIVELGRSLPATEAAASLSQSSAAEASSSRAPAVTSPANSRTSSGTIMLSR